MADRLQSFGHLRDINLDLGRVTAVISTGDVARDGMVIDPEGWDFTNYDRNPVVLWMHEDDAMPFARTVEHSAMGGQLVATAEFDLEDPMGLSIFRKIQRGYINATSVRWNPLRWEWVTVDGREILHFREQELLEWSFVTIPADPTALIARVDGVALDLSVFSPILPASAPHEAVGGAVLPGPAPSTAAIERFAERMAAIIERRVTRPSFDDQIITAVMAHTGRDEHTVRRMLAGGGV